MHTKKQWAQVKKLIRQRATNEHEVKEIEDVKGNKFRIFIVMKKEGRVAISIY